MNEQHNNRRCLVCKSTRWINDSLGGYVCERGHKADIVNLAEEEVQHVKGRKKRKALRTSSRRNDESSQAFSGEKAYYCFLSAYQLVLRAFIHSMIHDLGCPLEYESVMQQLWLLYINKLPKLTAPREWVRELESPAADSDNENVDYAEMVEDIAFRSELEERIPTYDIQSTNEAEDEEYNDETDVENEQILSTSRITSPAMLYLLVLCYYGVLWMRLPILFIDIHRAANNGVIPYFNARAILPTALKNRLAGYIRNGFNHDLMPVELCLRVVRKFAEFYKSNYGITFPEINTPPLMYRYIRDLMLPPELYVVVREIANVTQTSFTINHAKGTPMPWEILMAFVIIAAKMLYGLDGKERVFNQNDQFVIYMPSKQDWLKTLSERRADIFNQNLPFNWRQWQSFSEHNPDKYVDICSSNVVGNKQRTRRRFRYKQNNADAIAAFFTQQERPMSASTSTSASSSTSLLIERIQKLFQSVNIESAALKMRNSQSEDPSTSCNQPSIGQEYTMYRDREANPFLTAPSEEYNSDYENVLGFAANYLGITSSRMQRIVFAQEVKLNEIIYETAI
ncbi:1996_t:CDS:2 [Paraglomus occultum]|uniref:1996_t:CDS:1 n=1 Tax=Paraglomus occultum TaxID=144539 RepID=A0A9N8WDY9_9GLOM|nr:1996_t:CDS:2 [Paraglomus occultum]